MNIHGSTISFPLRPDVRGSVATTANRADQIAQAIADVLETRQGERVCLPNYGLPDFIFTVQDFGFAARVAFHLEQQILSYVPLVKSVRVISAKDSENRAIIEIQYTEVRQVNAPRNLVFPVWRMIEQ